MNIQKNIDPFKTYTDFTSEFRTENRQTPRYRIKRRLLIKDPQGHILTGHALDISSQGLQFRCSPQTAFLLKTKSHEPSRKYGLSHEIKIALPYMNDLKECGIHCSVMEIVKADEESMRVGLSFLYFEEESQSYLEHFLANLTLQ